MQPFFGAYGKGAGLMNKGFTTVFEAHYGLYVEMLRKRLIPCCLWLPTSAGYLVE